MSGFQINDTIATVIRVLQHHQDIIRVWHEVTALLEKLGFLTPQQVQQQLQAMRATHAYDVKWIQDSVNKQTGLTIKVDGIIGPETLDAVRVYQGKRKLQQDGWPGPLTLAQLEKDMRGP